MPFVLDETPPAKSQLYTTGVAVCVLVAVIGVVPSLHTSVARLKAGSIISTYTTGRHVSGPSPHKFLALTQILPPVGPFQRTTKVPVLSSCTLVAVAGTVHKYIKFGSGVNTL